MPRKICLFCLIGTLCTIVDSMQVAYAYVSNSKVNYRWGVPRWHGKNWEAIPSSIRPFSYLTCKIASTFG
jgi:hypothetical protein